MEEVKNEVEFQIDEVEKEALRQYRAYIDQQKFGLGELRIQYLKSEARILQTIAKSEERYLEYLKNLAIQKGLDITNQQWEFEPSGGVFKRRE
jgi:hypothetical protein